MSRARLLVTASTYPGAPDDGTPAFVRDLALREADRFDTLVVVPRVPDAPAVERHGAMVVRRFAYFPRRWEDLAHGAIIENIRARRSRLLQVVPFLAAEALAVARAVRSFRPDVAHVHWIIPQGLVVSLVAPRLPMVLTTLGGDLYALDAGPLRRLKSWVVRRAGAVTVMNEEMAERVVAMGADPSRVQVLPMGVDTAAFRVPRTPSPDGALRLLFVGRLVEKKGLAVLLDALRDVEVPWRLTVVGDGPLRSSLEARAAGLPVDFVGQLGRTDLARTYAAHDVVVVPSVPAASGDKDGLPVALLEAMTSGCAIIASRLPGIDEVVQEGRSGRLVPPADGAALAAAVTDLAGDLEQVARLGERARERALEYGVDRRGAQYTDLLEAVAGRSPRSLQVDDEARERETTR